jgi:hypothetical protein
MNNSPNLYLVSVLAEMNSALSKLESEPTDIIRLVPELFDSIINIYLQNS